MAVDNVWLLGTLLTRGLVTAEEAASFRVQSKTEPLVPLLIAEGLLTPRQLEHLKKEFAACLTGSPILPGYRIVDLVRKGGMATVYRAVQERMDRTVALKIFDGADPHSRPDASAFLREARLAACINHPNIVTVHDVGAFGTWLFCAMEYIEGGDADDLARRHGGRLPLQRALEIAWDASRGLEALHERNVIHRDIKPGNILVAPGGIAKLSDFGLACLAQDVNDSNHTIVGTPQYIAPELLSGSSATVSSDIYGIGATLFALLSGHPPYEGNNISQLVAQITHSPAIDPKKYIKEIPDDVDGLLKRCLSKNPADRPASAVELSMALEDLIRVRINARIDPHTTSIFRKPVVVGSKTTSPETPIHLRTGPTLRDQHSFIGTMPKVLESRQYPGADAQIRSHVAKHPSTWLLLEARYVHQVLSTDMAFYYAWYDLMVHHGGCLAVIGMPRVSYDRCQVLGLTNIVPFYASLEEWYRGRATASRDSTWSVFPMPPPAKIAGQ